MLARPAIGFIVEGLTEFQSYPSLVCRCVCEGRTMHVPIANGRGNSRVRNELEELLEDLVKTHHPHSIIVSLDALEVLREEAFPTCADLRRNLQSRCDSWLAGQLSAGRLLQLPLRIVVVIQHPTFESWLIADVDGLRATVDVIEGVAADTEWDNVDEQVPSPGAWIGRCIRRGVKLKPNGAVKIARKIDPRTVEQKSRSFRKFAKETRAAYETWRAACEL